MTDRTGLDELVGLLRSYLHLPDAGYVVFSLAIAAASVLSGDPLWGLLVGVPSGGKTEAIRLHDDVADDHIGDITLAGLLTWSGGKRPRPIGLLARIGTGPSFVTVSDMSSTLAGSNRGERDALFAGLRDVFDGFWKRDLGIGAGPLEWRGRMAILAAVTPAIDRYAAHNDALGPRWLYFRLPDLGVSDLLAATSAAVAAPEERDLARRAARTKAASVVREARSRLPDVVLTAEARAWLPKVALAAAHGRAAVERGGHQRNILGVPIVEQPSRLVLQMNQLWRGAVAVGCSPDGASYLCTKAALDSMPGTRRRVLDALARMEAATVNDLAAATRLDWRTIDRVLEDMETVGVCRRSDGRGRWAWGDEEIGPIVAEAVGVEREWTKRGFFTTTPQQVPPAQVAETPQIVHSGSARAGAPVLRGDDRGAALHAIVERLSGGPVVRETLISEIEATLCGSRRRDRVQLTQSVLREGIRAGRFTRYNRADVTWIALQPEIPTLFEADGAG